MLQQPKSITRILSFELKKCLFFFYLSFFSAEFKVFEKHYFLDSNRHFLQIH